MDTCLNLSEPYNRRLGGTVESEDSSLNTYSHNLTLQGKLPAMKYLTRDHNRSHSKYLIMVMLSLMFLMSSLHANEKDSKNLRFYSYRAPMHLPGNDYFRVTANEQLFLFYQDSEKSPFFIINELRYYFFNYYGYRLGASLKPWVDFIRVTNIISTNYRFINNTFLSIKIPYVKLEGWASNYGLSDIFIGIHYAINQFPVNRVVISSGVKLPVGYYKYSIDTWPLSTGSCDIPIMITNSFKIIGFDIITDIGYIFNGKSDMLIPPQLNKIKQDLERLYGTNYFEQNNGDEIVADLAIIKQFERLVVMLEMNYSYIFNTYLINTDVIGGHKHSKLNITPIILINKLENIKFEMGLSYDLYGKNIFCGYSPLFRIHFSK